MGHVHAELMAMYAEDAKETDRPWERWEFRNKDSSNWIPIDGTHPIWTYRAEYRRKPRTIMINGHEVPEPLRLMPKDGDDYFIAETDYDLDPDTPYEWESDEVDIYRFNAGLIHATKEAAIAHAKALLSFTEIKEPK